ncbi:TPA: ferric-rhodotorulic acid/ferric-coprogen receptor FhuE [Citrobacter braakii]|jgi:outer membrane receptor for ferric coprogen and ferric-rhodotorulic acid|uniref:Ferric-rhodotorulic acid/ferric-coprogen receptor FhuE n=1 Tax=Citrobacter braakii TaxID=57706 RepID=A0A1V8P4P8_CITBR|nr:MULTISPECIES: ferric-rhodotorulic acid/ferric-coprogen receptor FhuE [Citrobacter]MBS6001075.1 ferric-rhodotorulic acid/ferric-coprogen receptor FhuE [Citrobacter sp.]MEB0940353.1 ferric-rhodotorulic acid/ferric-coprogen receptor FhuE [Citrobacter braakii]MEB0945562.1 ferric-rhodotorulic acid/ferric-coprogen receptor FhuE [Citrobacter braakii]MEB0970370.1 ferric-rhodotorulic acid/ferric-coprogen receptor FhuE [Citrobacter braakii]MEB0994764.1 ferric-rhodotorulic acid/ferric-coprogen recepto
MSFTTHNGDDQRQPGLAPSVLAACITLALLPSTSLAAPAEETVIVEGSAPATSSEEQDYSVKSTTAGTKMQMTQRDIPQSVSIISQQRMEDQQLQTLGDVMDNTLGISRSQADSDRSSYYSRGFQIDNYMVDGIPTYFESRWNLGDALSDTALFERVEVVRGANGLMTGTGNPSASINMIRKHASSREFTGNVSAEYGSWNKQRYVTDLQSPLTADGNVRGRIVAGYQNNDAWLDRYNSEKMFFSGIVDADLGGTTSLSVGYEYQRIDINSPTWGGLPRWNTDGSKNSYDRSRSTAPDWAYNDKDFNKVFVTIKQRFADTWQATMNATHSEVKFDSKMMYVDAYVNKADGTLIGPYSSYGPGYDYVGGTGWNSGKRKVDAVDLFADGGYDLFGRQHNLMLGGSYSKQNNRYESAWANVFPNEIGSFYTFDGNFPETNWNPQSLAQDDTTHMKSLYAATRISLADPLHLIVGARYTNWRIDTLSYSMEQNHTTPYAGLVYDIDDNWSTYASYTSIFQPQNKRDSSGKYLSPITGNNYELGLKSDWMNSRLTTTLAVFRIEQDNVGQSTGVPISGSNGDTAYRAMDGTVSKGVEFEVNGAITDNWQMTFGATRYVAEDNEGNAVNPNLPRTTVKLFTRYRLPAMPELTVGGGVNWQNRVYSDTVTPFGTFRAEQGSYALVDLFTRYQVTKNFSVQGNLNNLFDKTYDTNVDGSIVYGEPRNVSVTASYQF